MRQGTTRIMRSLEEKRSIVEVAIRPGAAVAAVARRYGVNANLLFGWRRLYEQGLLSSRVQHSTLVPVMTTIAPRTDKVSAAASPTMLESPGVGSGVVEVELPNGIRFWLRGAVEATVVTAVCQALSGRC